LRILPAIVPGKRPTINSDDRQDGDGCAGGKPLTEKDILCLSHLQRAFVLLDRLHEVGCGRDKAGNRELFFDDYCKLVLLHTWNPLIQSVQDLQQVVGLDKVAKALGVKRFSSGSFSESVRVFEPEKLKPIIAELAGQLTPAPGDPRLASLGHVLTLVDGTVLRALERLTKAAVGIAGRYSTSRDGRAVYGWRLHTQLDLQSLLPHRMDRTGARNGGANRESNVLRRTLEAGRCYVADGGYADRTLFGDIEKTGSSFVIRTREDAVNDVVEERLLSEEALAAGIVRDALVSFQGDQEQTPYVIRRVEIEVRPHERRVRGGFKQSDLIVMYSSLRDLEPELVAAIYRYRYTVELFFRILKQLLGMRHLISQREEGIDIQICCAVIICILIQLISGKRPNKAMRNMIGWYLLGLASQEEVIAFLNKPDNTGVKLRAKDELWKKWGV
jgi:hypothetical protein